MQLTLVSVCVCCTSSIEKSSHVQYILVNLPLSLKVLATMIIKICVSSCLHQNVMLDVDNYLKTKNTLLLSEADIESSC